MLVPMTPVRILARVGQLPAVLDTLQRQGTVQLMPAARPELDLRPHQTPESDADRQARLRTEAADLAALLNLAEAVKTATDATPATADSLRTASTAIPEDRLNRLAPGLAPLLARLEALQAEHESTRRYRDALAALLPIDPDLACLDGADLSQLDLATVLLVLDAPDVAVLDKLRDAVRAVIGEGFHLVGAQTGAQTVGCVLVLPRPAAAELHALLRNEQVRHVALAPDYERLSPHRALRSLRARLAVVRAELAEAWQQLRDSTDEHVAAWRRRLPAVLDEMDRLEAAALTGSTERTVAVTGWVPRSSVEALGAALREIAADITLTRLDAATLGEPPTLLANPPRVRPYERLVGFFGLPRGGTLDPSGLMAVGLPVLFGLMVGDLVYGAALAGVGLLVRRRGTAERPLLRELGAILLVGGAAAMLFGLLFGEALGSLGHQLGMPALWFYRGGPEHLGTLLLLAIGVGLTHVLLGLLLGIRQAHRVRNPRTLLERVGTFGLLSGMAAIAATAADLLPAQVRTPAVVLVAVAFALAIAGRGAMGLLTGPLEMLGSLGNVLSYLRLAAVGLASVYLAGVANSLAVSVPLLLGVIVAVLLHLLNLALAAFSPLIQGLRLHYVEFFHTFYDDGGTAYRPFRRRLPEPAVD
jgi:V/A-type H+-transporting ATPase subunit I